MLFLAQQCNRTAGCSTSPNGRYLESMINLENMSNIRLKKWLKQTREEDIAGRRYSFRDLGTDGVNSQRSGRGGSNERRKGYTSKYRAESVTISHGL